MAKWRWPIVNCLATLGVLALPAGAEVATQRLRPLPDAPANTLRFGLSGLPGNAKVYRADLCLGLSEPRTGAQDDALIHIEIVPLLDAGKEGKPLELRAPWFDGFDATEATRAACSFVNRPRDRAANFLVKACPSRKSESTWLDVAYEGTPARVPPQAKGVQASHRAGQTFIVFEEIDDRSAAPSPTWANLKKSLDTMDAEQVVRYRVYRHTAPVTAASLPEAELLGEAKPMSGYNVLGRSVDQLIALHRRRAIDDLDFAKQLARQNYFERYNPDMPEMGEVPIARFAIEDVGARHASPLPPRMGLYVHTVSATAGFRATAGLSSRAPGDGTVGQADRGTAGKAYYAVVSVVDGIANTKELSSVGPVEETVGPGEPVLQGKPDVTVFFDYPGERRQYVQWAAPPLANLPNQYTNWGVFVPRGYETRRDAGASKTGHPDGGPSGREAKRLSVFFHDATQRFLKPPWPHRQDTVLLSPHDAPYRSFGYGYHEALGTLRSFRQGKVQPFFARRVDAMLEWALKKFAADPARVSCGGSGYWGGTAALQYGLRRPGKIAYVMAEGSPDPDPQQTPYEFEMYGKRKTQRPDLDAVWGKAEWKVEAESGKPVWEEMDLVSYVLANGHKVALPFLSLGAGSQHLAWKQEAGLMKAYRETRNGFMAEFFWGSSHHMHLPISAEEGEYPFEPRADRPILACESKDRGPNPEFFAKHFETGERGYGSGGRLNTQPRWDSEDVVDEPDRLEITICTAKRVVYAGRVTCDVAVRNTQKFRPPPGEKLAWTAPDPQEKRKTQQGEAQVDEQGRILIKGLQFGEPGRLVIRRAEGKP